MTDSHSRAVSLFYLFTAMGAPVTAGELLDNCERFRKVWKNHRQLLRPLGEYGARTSTTGSENPGGGFLPVAGAQAPSSFSSLSTPAGDAPGAAGGDPIILAAEPLIVIWPSGQAEMM